MAKKGTLVVRFIGDLKEFEQSQKKMGTDLTKTGKAIDSSLTKQFGEASTAATNLGKDFDSSQRKIGNSLSGTGRKIGGALTQPLGDASTAVKTVSGDFQTGMKKVDTALDGTGKNAGDLSKTFKTEMDGAGDSVGGLGKKISGLSGDVRDETRQIGTALGDVGSAAKDLGADFDTGLGDVERNIGGIGRKVDAGIVQPLHGAGDAVGTFRSDFSSEMDRVESKITGTRRELDQFKREMQGLDVKVGFNDAEAQSGLDDLFSGVKSDAGNAGSVAGSVLIAELVDSIQAREKAGAAATATEGFFASTTREASSAGKEAGGEFMDALGIKMENKAAGIGAAAAAAVSLAFLDSLQAEADVDTVAAQLGVDKKRQEQLGRVAGRVFANNWADSVGEAASAIGAVESSIGGFRNTSDRALERVSSKVSALANLFELDIPRVAQIAGQSVQTGMAKNADQSLDLLTKSLQRVPAAVREDLLDALDEYSPFLQTLGLEGKQAFGILVNASKKGMYGIDKAGDALKEFTIRSTDMSTASKQAYKTIGLDAETMANKILAGGDTANRAFNKIITGLLNIEDPADRANTAIKLFGTPIEDLNVAEIPRFLKGLRDGGQELKHFAGSTDRAMTTMSDNVQGQFKTLLNNLRLGAQDVVGGLFEGDWGRTYDGLRRIFDNLLEIARKNWRVIALYVAGPAILVWEQAIKKWGGKVGGFFSAQWRRFAGFFRDGMDKVKEVVSDGLDKVVDYFRDTPIDKIIRDLMNLIPNLIKKGMGKAKDLFFDALKWIGGKIRDVDWVKLFGKILDGIKNGVGNACAWVKQKITDTISDIGEKIRNINWGEIFSRLWDGIRKIFKAAGKDLFGITRNFAADVVDKFFSFAGWMLNAADKAFGWIPGIGDKLDNAKSEFEDFRQAVNDKIRGIDSSRDIHLKLVPNKAFGSLIAAGLGKAAFTGSAVGLAAGKRLGGPIEGGTPGRDSVPIMAMRDEHMWTTSDVRKAGGHSAMYRLRGMAQSGALKQLLDMGVPRMARGGPVGGREQGVRPVPENLGKVERIIGLAARAANKLTGSIFMAVKQSALMSGNVGAALKWARNQVGDDYLMGGDGPNVWDCSGFMGGITHVLRGENPNNSRIGSTASFPWPGFSPGADPRGFTIGSTPNYGGSGIGHMAGTLGGVNVESRGGEGVVVGPRARGYNDPGFTQVYHLTGIKSTRGGGADIGALGKFEKKIILAEAGGLFNVKANNPTSSAFGLGQLIEANRIKYARRLGFPWGIERGDTGTTNRDRQIAMMRAYIKDRYGGAGRAWAYHQRHGTYDQGGILRPGITIAHNNTGRNEYVTREDPRRRRGPTRVTLEIAGHQIDAVLRGLIDEQLEDEFHYQSR